MQDWFFMLFKKKDASFSFYAAINGNGLNKGSFKKYW